jgi:hypothetical protein
MGAVFSLRTADFKYRNLSKSYAMMVQMWQNILKPFIQDNEQLQQISLSNGCYGFVSQTLLIEPEFKRLESLENEILQQLSVISDREDR